MTVDRKFIKNIPVRLNLKIMLVTNNFVALPDNSKALPSRLIPLRFTKTFQDKEDLSLGAKLRLEQSGILNWSLEGFRSLYLADGRFTLPASSRELMDQLNFESAPLQAFIQDVCILDPRKAVYQHSLYKRYNDWCKLYKLDRAANHRRFQPRSTFGGSASVFEASQISRLLPAGLHDRVDRTRRSNRGRPSVCLGRFVLPNSLRRTAESGWTPHEAAHSGAGEKRNQARHRRRLDEQLFDLNVSGPVELALRVTSIP